MTPDCPWSRCTGALARTAQALASVLLLVIFVLINLEVICRYLFGTSTLVADEYSAYCFAAMAYLGLTHSLHHNRLIKVDLPQGWHGFTESRPVRLFVAALGVLLNFTLLYALFLTVSMSWKFQSRSIQPSQTLLAYPQAVVLLGLALATLTALLIFLRTFKRREPRP